VPTENIIIVLGMSTLEFDSYQATLSMSCPWCVPIRKDCYLRDVPI